MDLDAEEIPRKDDVTFMLQPAPCTAASGKSGLDQSLVIFCVDTSGSMCVTTEVRRTEYSVKHAYTLPKLASLRCHVRTGIHRKNRTTGVEFQEKLMTTFKT